MNTPLVLLVEDEPLLRDLITSVLHEIGANVVAVDTAERAASLLNDQPWDMLITDVRTPGAIDGVHLAWAAFHEVPHLPIVVTSGYSGRSGDELPPEATFIAKPWGIAEFLDVVNGRMQHAQGQH